MPPIRSTLVPAQISNRTSCFVLSLCYPEKQRNGLDHAVNYVERPLYERGRLQIEGGQFSRALQCWLKAPRQVLIRPRVWRTMDKDIAKRQSLTYWLASNHCHIPNTRPCQGICLIQQPRDWLKKAAILSQLGYLAKTSPSCSCSSPYFALETPSAMSGMKIFVRPCLIRQHKTCSSHSSPEMKKVLSGKRLMRL